MAGLNVKSDISFTSMSVDETADTQEGTSRAKSKKPRMHCQPSTPENATVTPRCSKALMDIEENAEIEFERYDDLQKVAESEVTRQAEELFTKIFNAKVVSEHVQIEKLKGEIRQMAQSYNEKGALCDAQVAERFEEVQIEKQQGKMCKDNRAIVRTALETLKNADSLKF
jgi:hypothetical protein